MISTCSSMLVVGGGKKKSYNRGRSAKPAIPYYNTAPSLLPRALFPATSSCRSSPGCSVCHWALTSTKVSWCSAKKTFLVMQQLQHASNKE